MLICRTAERDSVAGVLEVIQTSEDMVFAQLVDILSEELERCNLYTVDDIQRAQLRKKAPELLAASGSTSKADNSTHISTSQNGSTNGSPKSINVPAPETGLPEVIASCCAFTHVFRDPTLSFCGQQQEGCRFSRQVDLSSCICRKHHQLTVQYCIADVIPAPCPRHNCQQSSLL